MLDMFNCVVVQLQMRYTFTLLHQVRLYATRTLCSRQTLTSCCNSWSDREKKKHHSTETAFSQTHGKHFLCLRALDHRHQALLLFPLPLLLLPCLFRQTAAGCIGDICYHQRFNSVCCHPVDGWFSCSILPWLWGFGDTWWDWSHITLGGEGRSFIQETK